MRIVDVGDVIFVVDHPVQFFWSIDNVLDDFMHDGLAVMVCRTPSDETIFADSAGGLFFMSDHFLNMQGLRRK